MKIAILGLGYVGRESRWELAEREVKGGKTGRKVGMCEG
jgi:hypothetical protein